MSRMPNGMLLGTGWSAASATCRSSDQRRSRDRYHSGCGCPALQTVSRFVGAKNVDTRAVAKHPSGEQATNVRFIARTNSAWSMKLTNRRISPRRRTATSATPAPCPATSASSRRLIRPVAQLEA